MARINEPKLKRQYCYVLKCVGSLPQEVVTSINQVIGICSDGLREKLPSNIPKKHFIYDVRPRNASILSELRLNSDKVIIKEIDTDSPNIYENIPIHQFDRNKPTKLKLTPESQKQKLKHKTWYHANIGRSEAEAMLTKVNTKNI